MVRWIYPMRATAHHSRARSIEAGTTLRAELWALAVLHKTSQLGEGTGKGERRWM